MLTTRVTAPGATTARSVLTALALFASSTPSLAADGLAMAEPDASIASTGEISSAPGRRSGRFIRGQAGVPAAGARHGDGGAGEADDGTGPQAREPQAARGPAGRAIFGTDDRIQVTPTTTLAARMNVLITFNQGGVPKRCSGAMIGPDTVATAGHCLHTGGSGGSWSTNVVVYPARNGAQSPFGNCQARRLHAPVGWVRDGLDRHDYGAIKLNCFVGLDTGWYGLLSLAGSLTGQPTHIWGYPADKPLTMWRTRTNAQSSTKDFIFYRNDVDPGMEGAPVFNVTALCGRCLIGIHTREPHGTSPPYSNNNYGIRMRLSVLENLAYWTDLP